MKRYCMALDLVDDPQLIAEYDAYHKAIWPEIVNAIATAGIAEMEIYRAGNRLFMIMEVTEGFSMQAKAASDAANPKVQEWESLMWKYQQALPIADAGEKWVMMNCIFSLRDQFTPQ
ncbi:L-rhamnose mutarotase [Filimonas effusa]|uniref:L-rhamnose mutarotase n=1 Tax=Filimonas effusa TaxID=2508721 RepID=A0A4Q1DEZ7_9BACT|nr:L-rhamnose mutarotase [Filimonas effusa]RXK87263.1 L-rhamnose mutarotase [Filimonas effusa]